MPGCGTVGRLIFAVLILVTGWTPALAQDPEGPPADTLEAAYQEMRSRVVALYQEERFREAAALLEDALPRFPGHLHANCFNLALMHVRQGMGPEALEALRYGLDAGIWYGKYQFLEDLWVPLREAPGWQAFQGQNMEALERAQARVAPRLEVRLPKGYDPSRSYPLFLALHGGGENLDIFMPQWTSDALEREFIVAYPQSTRLILPNGYAWTEDMDLSLKEIQEVYREVVGHYPVDTTRVLVGGFSSGGVASLEVVIRNTLPVRGFIVLCPAMPEDFTPDRARAARDRGVRGTLLTTERDNRVPEQRKMSEIMSEAGLPHDFQIFPNMGHWYPEDFSQRLDNAIARVLKREGEGPEGGLLSFQDSGQALGGEDSRCVVLADLDGDGDLGAFVVNNSWLRGDPTNRVWLNTLR